MKGKISHTRFVNFAEVFLISTNPNVQRAYVEVLFFYGAGLYLSSFFLSRSFFFIYFSSPSGQLINHPPLTRELISGPYCLILLTAVSRCSTNDRIICFSAAAKQKYVSMNRIKLLLHS